MMLSNRVAFAWVIPKLSPELGVGLGDGDGDGDGDAGEAGSGVSQTRLPRQVLTMTAAGWCRGHFQYFRKAEAITHSHLPGLGQLKPRHRTKQFSVTGHRRTQLVTRKANDHVRRKPRPLLLLGRCLGRGPSLWQLCLERTHTIKELRTAGTCVSCGYAHLLPCCFHF